MSKVQDTKKLIKGLITLSNSEHSLQNIMGSKAIINVKYVRIRNVEAVSPVHKLRKFL